MVMLTRIISNLGSHLSIDFVWFSFSYALV